MDDVSAISVPGDAGLELLREEIRALKAALISRGRIEHVVGMLMLLLACNESVAWENLRYLSSMTNRKARDLADLIAASAAAGGPPLPADVINVLRDILGSGWSPFT